MHRGKAAVGIAAGNFKTGRYSKNLPTRMLEKYQEARTDGDLLALRDDIALVDSRLEDMLGRVDTGESGEMWASLLSSLEECKKQRHKLDNARRTQDQKKILDAESGLTDALDTMEVLAQAGLSDYAAWGEIRSLLEQRRRTARVSVRRAERSRSRSACLRCVMCGCGQAGAAWRLSSALIAGGGKQHELWDSQTDGRRLFPHKAEPLPSLRPSVYPEGRLGLLRAASQAAVQSAHGFR